MNNGTPWMEEALKDLDTTLVQRNKAYKLDGEFSNFEFAAELAGVAPLDVIMAQTMIKLGRIKGQMKNGESGFDSMLDSYRDFAGYATIMFAYVLREFTELRVAENVGEDEEW